MAPDAWDTETAKRINVPVYFAEIEDIGSKFYSTHPVKSPSRTIVVSLEIWSGTTQTLDTLLRKASVGEIEVVIRDTDGEMTDLVATDKASPTVDTLINRDFTMWGGYSNLAESLYRTVFSGEIRDAEEIEPGRFRFRVVARTRRLEELLDNGVEVLTFTLDAASGIGSTTIEVTGGPVPNITPPQEFLLYRRDGSQEEKVTVTAVDSGVLTLQNPLENGWVVGDVLTNAPRLKGNLVNVFYSVLTGNFSTAPYQFGSFVTDFPLLAADNNPAGLDFTDAELDLDLLKEIRDKFYADYDIDLFIERPIKARTLMEREIFPLGFFLLITTAGKIAGRAFVPPGPETATPIEILKQDMVGYPTWRRKMLDHYNRVQVTGDYDLGPEADVELVLLEDTANQTATKEVVEVVINSKALRSALDGTALANHLAQRILNRWSTAPVELDVSTLFTKRETEIGKTVRVTHPSVPNTETGLRGLDRVAYEVIRATPNPKQGTMDLELQRSSQGKWIWIGSNTLSDFASATPEEKEFGYMGDSNNEPAVGVAGYLVF